MSDKYGTGEDRHYCYPGSDVLINKLGITDPTALASAEVSLTQARLQTFEPDFEDFSLSALRKIHFHLFQDIYPWAGSLRTIDVSKGATRFANALRIEPEADKLFEQLARECQLVNLSREQFTQRLAHYYCELNVIHPFRDGNGRAQRVMFEIICINAGYLPRWDPIEREEWIAANIAAYHCKLDPLIKLLDRVLTLS